MTEENTVSEKTIELAIKMMEVLKDQPTSVCWQASQICLLRIVKAILQQTENSSQRKKIIKECLDNIKFNLES